VRSCRVGTENFIIICLGQLGQTPDNIKSGVDHSSQVLGCFKMVCVIRVLFCGDFESGGSVKLGQNMFKTLKKVIKSSSRIFLSGLCQSNIVV
jgi:hypothetical protein